MKDFTYIDSEESLFKCAEKWNNEDCIGVDLECENNLHHYGVYISLIQLSTSGGNYVVDVMKLNDLSPLVDVFESSGVQKIFHDISFDLRILNYQFGCRPKNIFDTQLAALFLGMENVGLGALLEDFFGVRKEKRFQMADWSKRPLSEDMLSYAVKDTSYLIELRDQLAGLLSEKGRLSWVKEECSLFEKKEFNYKKQTYLDVKGASQLTAREKARLKRFFDLREDFAKKLNKPTFYVLRPKMLIELAKNPPRDIVAWRALKGVHPVVRKNAHLFFEECRAAEKERVMSADHVKKEFTRDQKENFRIFSELRKELADKLSIPSYLVLNKKQLEMIAVSNSVSSLSSWQQKLLKSQRVFPETLK